MGHIHKSTSKIEFLQKILNKNQKDIDYLQNKNSRLELKFCRHISDGSFKPEVIVNAILEGCFDDKMGKKINKWLEKNNEDNFKRLLQDPKLLLDLSGSSLNSEQQEIEHIDGNNLIEQIDPIVEDLKDDQAVIKNDEIQEQASSNANVTKVENFLRLNFFN